MTSCSPAGAVVRRAGLNVGKLISGKAGAGVASLLYMLIAVRVLGAHDYGVLILVHTFAAVVGGCLAIPGAQTVVRYGAQATEAGDDARLLRLLRGAAAAEAGVGACAVAIAAIAAPLVGPHIAWSQTALDFALPSSFAVLAAMQTTAAGYLQLRGRFDLIAAHALVSPLVRLAGACLVWATGGGLQAFLVVWLLSALAHAGAMWALGLLVLRGRLRGAALRGPLRGVVAENPGLWRFVLGAKLDSVLSDLAPRITSLVIGWVAGAAATGLYAVAQRPSKLVSQPAKLFGQAAYAEFARIAAAAGHSGAMIRGVLFRSCGVLLALTVPILLVLAFAAHPLARLIGGRAFEQAGDVVLLIALARAAQVVAPPSRAALVALGRPGLVVIANFMGCVALLPMLPLLLNAFGLVGAGVQLLVQAAVVSSLVLAFVWRCSRDRGETIQDSARRMARPTRRQAAAAAGG